MPASVKQEAFMKEILLKHNLTIDLDFKKMEYKDIKQLIDGLKSSNGRKYLFRSVLKKNTQKI